MHSELGNKRGGLDWWVRWLRVDLVIRFGGWIWWRGGWIAGLDDGCGSPDGALCCMVCGFGVGVLEGGFVRSYCCNVGVRYTLLARQIVKSAQQVQKAAFV